MPPVPEPAMIAPLASRPSQGFFSCSSFPRATVLCRVWLNSHSKA